MVRTNNCYKTITYLLIYAFSRYTTELVTHLFTDTTNSDSQSKLPHDWWFTASQCVLATSPLRIPTRDIFLTEPLRSYTLYNILSDEKIGFSLMNMFGLLSSVRITHVACYWEFFLLHFIHALCQYRLCLTDVSYAITAVCLARRWVYFLCTCIFLTFLQVYVSHT
jgi:hypothetical protein